MTPAELKQAATMELARRELARRELARRAALKVPDLEIAPLQVPEFDPDDALKLDEAVREEADRRILQTIGKVSDEQEQVILADVRKEKKAKRREMITAGREGAAALPEGGLPIFRTTRIVSTDAGPKYRDPKTGDLREPTAGEELTEAAARQPVLTEEAAREISRALNSGEQDLPLISGLLSTRPEELGTGIIETSLGATLRSVPGYLESAVAEAYFRGLGYEVDENGEPKDQSDFGLKVAKVRRGLGIPDVIQPVDLIKAYPKLSTEVRLGLGLADKVAPDFIKEGLSTAENFARAVPQLSIPTPGVATRREVGNIEASALDPEARRGAATGDVEAARRIARAVASGRSIGDEFVNAPAVLQAYKDIYGEDRGEMAAFIGGTVGSLGIPTGVGTSLKAFKGLGKAAVGTKAAEKLAGAAVALSRATPALKKVPAAMKGGPGIIDDAGLFTASIDKAAEAIHIGNRATQAAAFAARKAFAAIAPKKVAENVILEAVATRLLPEVPWSKETIAGGKAADYATEYADWLRKQGKVADARTAKLYADGLKGALEGALPADYVKISGKVAVPRALAPRVLAAMAAAGERGQNVTAAAVRAAEGSHRHLYDLSNLQVHLDGLARPGILDSMVARRISSLTGAGGESKTAALAEAEHKLRNISGEVLRGINKDIQALVRGGKGVDEALDAILAREIGEVATHKVLDAAPNLNRMTPEVPWSKETITAEAAEAARANPPQKLVDSIWQKMIDEMYGGEQIGKDIMAIVKEAGEADLTKLPTLAALRAVDKMPAVRARFPASIGPTIQRAVLKVILDEGVRKNIGRGVALETLLGFGVTGAHANANVFRPSAFRGVSQGQRAAAVSGPVQKFLDSPQELVKALESVPVRKRGPAWTALNQDLLTWLKAAKRGFKYGYIVPNVPFLMGRAMVAPLISAATIGWEKTVRGGASAFARNWGGVTSIAGKHFTPSKIEDLAREHGVGQTAVDSERVGRLAQDILDDAVRAIGVKKALGNLREKPSDLGMKLFRAIDPASKGFWVRMAEDVERTYRMGVFRSGLEQGLEPEQAAAFARRSLLDYGSPGSTAIREKAGLLFATAAQNYALMTEILPAIARNPNAITQITKLMRAKQRAIDPYGYYGDKSLRALGIFPVGPKGEETSIIGPQAPIFEPVEDVLGLLYGLSSTWTAVTEAEQLEDLTDASRRAGRKGADAIIPDIVAAIDLVGGVTGSKKGMSRDDIGSAGATDLQTFWRALLVADLQDPDHITGIWDTTRRFLDPVPVMAPKGMASEAGPQFWLVQPPEGTPYIHAGTDEVTGKPLYQVWKPSKRSLGIIKAIRKLTPEIVEDGLGVYAGTHVSPTLDISAVSPTGGYLSVGGAVILGTAAGSANPEVQEAARIEQIREVAEKR